MAFKMVIPVAAKPGERPSLARIQNERPSMVITAFAYRVTQNAKEVERRLRT